MADLLAEPRARHCRHGLVRCSNYRFRPALCLRHRPARPQRPGLDQRHSKSNSRMGCTSNNGSISLGCSSASPHPRSGSDLWQRRHTPIARLGHPGQAYRASLAFEAGGQGMLVVETVARIRREHFIKGKTIKEIARDLEASRNTVRKVLRSRETSFEYERDVQPRPKLGRWTKELDELVAGNAAKPAREQLTLIRIFEELRGRGYGGGYDAVRRYARRWAKERGQSTAAAYVPLSFAPGEAYQFDWSHEVVLLSGVTVIVKAAHGPPCHSRVPFVPVYPRETQEMVFDAHDRAFALFKGACGRGIYDNMKTAVETIF